MLEGTAGTDGVARGAYVLRDTRRRRPTWCSIGTGSEVCRVRSRPPTLLAAEGIAVRVVSMPCWELFEEQDDDYQDVGAARRRARRSPSRPASPSAGTAGPTTRVGIDRFGATAPGDGRPRASSASTAENVVDAGPRAARRLADLTVASRGGTTADERP